ncbi:hypothetical protein [Clostridium botulinum]|uniref:hypothetical protein n=1 Tax=Clostridium botulinum TaxID=1491 RepID=UPI001E3999A6|nr:hypothetical protein [Clostridium botulinum]MCD3223951.1 hypothetical protein [Clostridium botulinum C/D]MCD3297609.1 hypothetical protein [Clostridium botulinum C/D]
MLYNDYDNYKMYRLTQKYCNREVTQSLINNFKNDLIKLYCDKCFLKGNKNDIRLRHINTIFFYWTKQYDIAITLADIKEYKKLEIVELGTYSSECCGGCIHFEDCKVKEDKDMLYKVIGEAMWNVKNNNSIDINVHCNDYYEVGE